MASKSGPGSRASSGIERRTCMLLSSGPAHSGNPGQRQDSRKNVNRLRLLQFVHRDRAFDAEAAGLRAPQILEMSAATERFPNIVGVGAHVETFAANDAEIDFGRGDPLDGIAINMHQPRLALDRFALPRQFV